MLLHILYGKLLLVFLALIILEFNLAEKTERQIVFENEDDNQVQTSCRTPDGQSGICVRLTSCTFLVQTVKRSRLHQYFCGFEGNEPMVCCSMSTTRILEDGTTAKPTRGTTRRTTRILEDGTTARPTRSTTRRTTRGTKRPPTTTRRPTLRTTTRSDGEPRIGGEDIIETRIIETTLRPTRTQMDDTTKPSFLPQECGVSNSSLHTRIVNGTPAPPGSWPWFAVIFVRMASGVESPDCGGALVTRSHVVTAAHCLVDLNKKNIHPSRLSVRLGTHDLSTPNAPGTVNVGVEDVRMHEQFERNTYKNDIAVLKLSRPVDFTETVAPVCLPYDSMKNKDLTDRSVWVAGFGATSFNGGASKILLETSIKVQSEEICQMAYKELVKTEFTSVYMCAGVMDGSKDACQGDSGGPLTAIGENKNFYLVGIVSFGKECAKPGYPGVYTRVTQFLDWLQQKLSY